MARREGYIGAYINPAIKRQFLEIAEEEGLTQSMLIEKVISQHISDDNPSPVFQEPTYEEVEEINFEERFDNLGIRLQDQLNCILADGYSGVDDDSEYYVQDALNHIADKLDDEAENELEYQCAESFLTDNWLSERYGEETKEIISQAMDELGDLSLNKKVLFPTIASFMRQRAEQLYSNDRIMHFQFSREEWETLDRFIAIVNRDGEHEFPNVKSFLKFKLGEMMDYAGTGFWVTRDKAMRLIGQRFMDEVKGA